MQILNKRESTDGYRHGRFGNHLRVWDTPAEALRDCAGPFMIRWRGAGAGGPAWHVGVGRLEKIWRSAVSCRPELYYISERCTDDWLVFQGEIIETPHTNGYALHFSQAKKPQRVALALESDHYFGPGVKLLCKQFMDTDSYDDLNTLLDLYPGHTIEFSCFDRRLGSHHRNTIFWEVRFF